MHYRTQVEDWVLIRVKTLHPLKQTGRQSMSTEAGRWDNEGIPTDCYY